MVPEIMGCHLPSLSRQSVLTSAAAIWAETMISEYIDGRMEDTVRNSRTTTMTDHSFAPLTSRTLQPNPAVQPNNVHLLPEEREGHHGLPAHRCLLHHSRHQTLGLAHPIHPPTNPLHPPPLPRPTSSHAHSRMLTRQLWGYIF